MPTFNRRTYDAQSLKDIYAVTESLLAAEALIALSPSPSLTTNPLSPRSGFSPTFWSRAFALFQPQLRDLVVFLSALNAYLHTPPDVTMEAVPFSIVKVQAGCPKWFPFRLSSGFLFD